MCDRLTITGLVAKRALDAEDMAQLRELTDDCNRYDGILIKLNLGMMAHRDETRLNDFCYYVDGRLVGYMPLDDFGGKVEITGIVASAHRRKGIFRAMLEAARREIAGWQVTELLLVNYRASETGCAVAARLAFPYNSSEYCMEADATAIPALPSTEIHLETVTRATAEELSLMLKRSFEDGRWSSPEALLNELEMPDKRYFLARYEGQPIGQIGIITKNDHVYIRAVGILPERRHRGFGRQLLAATVKKMLAEGSLHFELDVATDNSQALALYHSCGFRETNIYDYYSVPLK